MSASKSRKKSRFRFILISVIVFAVVICLGVYYVYSLVYSPFKGYSEEKKIVVIQRGSSVDDMIHTLVYAGVLKDEQGFKVILKFKGGERSLLAGEYLFDRPMSAMEVYDKFRRGDVYYHRFTVPEGKDIYDISAIAEAEGLFRKEDLLSIMNDPALILDIDPSADSLEGYVFPDTYLVSRIMEPGEIVAKMIGNFREKYNGNLKGIIIAQGSDLRQIVIIASIIEKETSLPGERSIISSVIHNRLKIGMGLQMDPTIIYALKKDGAYDGNLKREHKAMDSPYNTYKYRGLPPGPICNPGISSLIAACSPADTKYLYYVSKNDGSHEFSTNVHDHNMAVYKWQKKYWRDKWREENLNKTGGAQPAPSNSQPKPKLIEDKKKEF
jgi:UPF0755 protein